MKNVLMIFILLFSLVGTAAATSEILINPDFQGTYTDGKADGWVKIGADVVLSENTNSTYYLYGNKSQHIVVPAGTTGKQGIQQSFKPSAANQTYLLNASYYLANGSSMLHIEYDIDTHIYLTATSVGWVNVSRTFTPTTNKTVYISLVAQTGQPVDMYASRVSVEQLKVTLNASTYNTSVNSVVDVVVNNIGGVARTASYSTYDGTAIGGTHYTPVSGVVSFSEGELTKTIQIPIHDFEIGKIRKSFSFRLSGENATSQNETTIYIKPPAGIVVVLDDHYVDSWYAQREFLNSLDAKVTFALAPVYEINAAEKAKLLELQADGHEIGDHTYNHTAVDVFVGTPKEYAEQCSVPMLNWLLENGFNTPTSFTYPGGARTATHDDELLKYHPIVRGVISNTVPLANNSAYYTWDGSRFIRGAEISVINNYTLESIYAGLDKAKANGDVVMVFSHQITDSPGQNDISIANFQAVMQYAHDIGLVFYRQCDLVDFEYPSGTLTANTTTVYVGDTVEFTYDGIAHANNVIDFDELGVTSETVNTTYTFKEAGRHNVRVTSTNYAGVHTDSIVITVKELPSTSSTLWQSALAMILVLVVVVFASAIFKAKDGKLDTEMMKTMVSGLIVLAITLIVGAIILSAF